MAAALAIPTGRCRTLCGPFLTGDLGPVALHSPTHPSLASLGSECGEDCLTSGVRPLWRHKNRPRIVTTLSVLDPGFSS